MKMGTVEWVKGRWDSDPNARMDGSWTISKIVSGFLDASQVMACGDLEKKLMIPFDGTKPPLGLLAYPSRFEIWDREFDNIISPISQPKFRGGQRTSVLIAGSMDVLISEEFNPTSDFNAMVYLLANGSLSLQEPSSGTYWVVGNVKKGIGKNVTVTFDFTNPMKKVAGVEGKSFELKSEDKKTLEEAKKLLEENKKNEKTEDKEVEGENKETFNSSIVKGGKK